MFVNREDRRRKVATRNLFTRLFLCCLLLWSPLAGPIFAYETDQYSNRLLPIKDSLDLMDFFVNRELERIVAEWHGPADEMGFARKIYWSLGGLHWVDHIEHMAMTDPNIQKLPQTRHQSIFSGMPLKATRVNYFFGVGRTIKVDGVLLGSDKFGHFFSQGLKYYKRLKRGASMEKVIKRGAFVERWWFGYLMTGVYSNADLVANYEGMLFYQSLFQDDVITGKGSIVGWQGNKPYLKRAFTWKDHVNDYWDEALNPSMFKPALQREMTLKLADLCDQYRQQPERYFPANDAALWERYRHIGLIDARYNRVDQVCATREKASVAAPIPLPSGGQQPGGDE